MAVNDVYEVTFTIDVKGETCFCVGHYRESGACTDLIPAQSLLEALQAAFFTDWAAINAVQTVIACAYARRIDPTPGVAYTLISNLAGDVAVDALPTTSACIVTWYSAIAGKRTRGRTYLPGLPEDAQDGGLLEDAAIAAIQDLAALMIGPIAAVGGDTGEWKRAVWSELNLTDADVIAAVVRSNLGTMRSRRQRPGQA